MSDSNVAAANIQATVSVIHSQQQQQQQLYNATTTAAGLPESMDFAKRMSLPLSHTTNADSAAETAASATPSSPSGVALAADTTASSGVNIGLGITLMQSSPPPHSYRHSRAYRHFKNPPQPHMCIRTTTDAGEELFINVLSWTRIVIPQEPSDPIPLYGGMRVPPGSPRSPPIVFAVMANPEVLKDSGRHSKDPEERRAMVELMCDFVEAMNPGVKLVRNAVILKDRDISGELKDVWNAVQAQRDREREEQLMQQRQQQHFHNITTQQMFPKPAENAANTTQQRSEQETTKTTSPEKENTATITTASTQQMDNKVRARQDAQHVDNINVVVNRSNNVANEHLANGIGMDIDCDTNENKILDNGNDNGDNDQIDASLKRLPTNDTNTISVKTNFKMQTNASHNTIDNLNQMQLANHTTNNIITNTTTTTTTTTPIVTAISPTSPTTTTATNAATVTTIAATTTTTAPTVAPAPTPPTKKEKLGGFLPNGCIFPRFKNNKHKDKDKEKEKEKEKETKSKEKTLLNALKKSKDKKVAPIENTERNAATNETDAKTQYEKNCINLESEVQKLDLNKIDTASSNDNNVFIKLKVTTSSAAAK